MDAVKSWLSVNEQKAWDWFVTATQEPLHLTGRRPRIFRIDDGTSLSRRVQLIEEWPVGTRVDIFSPSEADLLHFSPADLSSINSRGPVRFSIDPEIAQHSLESDIATAYAVLDQSFQSHYFDDARYIASKLSQRSRFGGRSPLASPRNTADRAVAVVEHKRWLGRRISELAQDITTETTALRQEFIPELAMLCEELGASNAILFGSYQDEGDSADMDVMLIVPEISLKLYNALVKLDLKSREVPIDVVFLEEEHAQAYFKLNNNTPYLCASAVALEPIQMPVSDPISARNRLVVQAQRRVRQLRGAINWARLDPEVVFSKSGFLHALSKAPRYVAAALQGLNNFHITEQMSLPTTDEADNIVLQLTGQQRVSLDADSTYVDLLRVQQQVALITEALHVPQYLWPSNKQAFSMLCYESPVFRGKTVALAHEATDRYWMRNA